MRYRAISAILTRLCVAAVLAAMLPAHAHKAFAMVPVLVQIGTEAPLGEFGVTLNRATLSGSVIEISYSVKNIGPTPAPLARFPALWLMDRKGGEVAASEDSARDHTLAPGETVIRAARFRLTPGTADPMAWLLRLGGAAGARITLR
jgi:hypothetical protein